MQRYAGMSSLEGINRSKGLLQSVIITILHSLIINFVLFAQDLQKWKNAPLGK